VLLPGEAAEFDTRVPHWLDRAGPEAVEFLSLFGRRVSACTSAPSLHGRLSDRRRALAGVYYDAPSSPETHLRCPGETRSFLALTQLR
jgi:hypothetical protein